MFFHQSDKISLQYNRQALGVVAAFASAPSSQHNNN